jgi:hypothetical protein
MRFGRSVADAHRRHGRAVHVLDADPDLGSGLSGPRLAEARRRLIAHEHVLPAGTWHGDRMQQAHGASLGLLVLEGLIARELLMRDNVSTELLGEGDLLRPWQASGPARLIRSEVRWTVLSATRVAMLGPAFGAELARYPEVHAVLAERMTERAHRLALAQAICQLNGVDQRVLTLLWHLAERWGRITPDGVAVPVVLSHRVIAQVVGARRPTVSTALAQLAAQGHVLRRDDGTWLLPGDPVGRPTRAVSRVIRPRRPQPRGAPRHPVIRPAGKPGGADATVARHGGARVGEGLGHGS